MAEHQHIILEGTVKQVDYMASGFSSFKIVDRGDPSAHSGMIRSQYSEAIEGFNGFSHKLPQGVEPVDGSYLNFRLDKAANSIDKFDSKTGVRLMNVHESHDGEDNQLTVFLPAKNNE